MGWLAVILQSISLSDRDERADLALSGGALRKDKNNFGPRCAPLSLTK